jgi:CRISPR-associated protein Csm4
MQTYRATLRPQGATRSPWQADTLFGHLCWLLYYTEGEVALHDLLDRYRTGAPPLLFSDGFPGDWLPRPLLPHLPGEHGPKAESIAAMRAAKQEQHVRWISLEEFEALRRGETIALTPRTDVSHVRPTLKNQINRLTGGTTLLEDIPGAGGNLYTVEERAFVDTSGLHPEGVDVAIYVRAEDAAWAERARAWLEQLSQSGYGARKSVGYGHFTLERWEPFPMLDTAPVGANGFISLSNWVPAHADPTEGFYHTLVKYGKLGETLANSENPFKFPLIMLTAGASFYAEPLRAWYGRLVTNIAPAAPQVVHYGYAFAVPAFLHDDRANQ